mmetsp:Transcript_13896/g.29658  ORF Transcript_13896/g.29658 Transcript_13896/m.29658 type:complete len:251 (-) Transcript_13896:368-1120(-)
MVVRMSLLPSTTRSFTSPMSPRISPSSSNSMTVPWRNSRTRSTLTLFSLSARRLPFSSVTRPFCMVRSRLRMIASWLLRTAACMVCMYAALCCRWRSWRSMASPRRPSVWSICVNSAFMFSSREASDARIAARVSLVLATVAITCSSCRSSARVSRSLPSWSPMISSSPSRMGRNAVHAIGSTSRRPLPKTSSPLARCARVAHAWREISRCWASPKEASPAYLSPRRHSAPRVALAAASSPAIKLARCAA